MKIKRYLDKDMRHVLRRVREEQGPDAVILSNRRVDGGIEVIAAVDYDEALVRHAIGQTGEAETMPGSDALARIAESDSTVPASPDIEILNARFTNVPQDEDSLAAMRAEMSSMRGLLETELSGLIWKDVAGRSPRRAEILRNLSRLGLAPDTSNIIVDRLGPTENIESLWQAPLAELAKTLPVVDDDLLQRGGAVALIGPTGVGKTTTIAKIAARFAMDNWQDDVALVSADAYRIGAKEHLSAFANIIGAKVYSVSNFDELSATLARLRDKKLVLIDTEGRSQRDRDLSSRLASYGKSTDQVRFYLTVSAATQEAVLDETIRQFRKVPLSGCIVTKIDEAAQLGCAMSALIRNDLPAAWFADGQRIPDDLHAAAHKKLWFVNKAIEGMRSAMPRVDEQQLAENYGRERLANVR